MGTLILPAITALVDATAGMMCFTTPKGVIAQVFQTALVFIVIIILVINYCSTTQPLGQWFTYNTIIADLGSPYVDTFQ